jgi:hypothetical protein
MDVRNYSLADHTISIETPNRNVTIGNGSSLETISVTFANDNFSFTVSPDGSATLNKNNMLNGTATISLQQTNPFVNVLIDLFKSQIINNVINTGRMIIKDTNGNINARFEKCVITKYPDYNAGPESQARDFVIAFGKGILE